MKIGLNATCFNNRPSGAKQRFIGLYTRLFKLMPDAEFVIFQPSDCNLEDWFSEPNIRFSNTPIPSEGRILKFIKGFNFWGPVLKKEKFDLFECFNIPTVKNKYGRTYQTIHDIRSLHFESSKLKKFLSIYAHNDTFKKADKIITVSQTMQSEILKHYPDANVEFLYNGIDLDVFSLDEARDPLVLNIGLVLPENFLLAVGHFEDRKNYDLLIDAIKHLKDTNSRQSLIIVGNDNGQKQRIENKLLSLNLEKNIFLFSNLTDEEVQIMYRLCSAFIFPSTYEGFGIPVLEAMAYEKPFILSNIEVFKEITENQGVYFEPLNVRSIAAAILKVCENPSISKKLQIYGKNRVKDFNFNFLAHDLKRLYMS